MNDYFAGRLERFELILAPVGTEFQQKVWKVLTEIPYGETKPMGRWHEGWGNRRQAGPWAMPMAGIRLLLSSHVTGLLRQAENWAGFPVVCTAKNIY